MVTRLLIVIIAITGLYTQPSRAFESAANLGFGSNRTNPDEAGSLMSFTVHQTYRQWFQYGLVSLGEGQQNKLYRMSAGPFVGYQTTDRGTYQLSITPYKETRLGSESVSSYRSEPRAESHQNGFRYQLSSSFEIYTVFGHQIRAGGFTAYLTPSSQGHWLTGATLGIHFRGL